MCKERNEVSFTPEIGKLVSFNAIIRQYWNQKQILYKVLIRWKLAFILAFNS